MVTLVCLAKTFNQAVAAMRASLHLLANKDCCTNAMWSSFFIANTTVPFTMYAICYFVIFSSVDEVIYLPIWSDYISNQLYSFFCLHLLIYTIHPIGDQRENARF